VNTSECVKWIITQNSHNRNNRASLIFAPNALPKIAPTRNHQTPCARLKAIFQSQLDHAFGLGKSEVAG